MFKQLVLLNPTGIVYIAVCLEYLMASQKAQTTRERPQTDKLLTCVCVCVGVGVGVCKPITLQTVGIYH